MHTSNTGPQQRSKCACSSPRQRQRQALEDLWAGQGLIRDDLVLVEIISFGYVELTQGEQSHQQQKLQKKQQ